MELDYLTYQIIGAACRVHTTLGPGLLEEPYKQCLKHALCKEGLQVSSEVFVPVNFDGIEIECGYRLDLLVENLVVVELKSVTAIAPIHKMQTLTYLKLSQKPVGLLINFNVPNLVQGVVRLVNHPPPCNSVPPC